MPRLSQAQQQALESLGVDRKNYGAFLTGILVPFEFPTERSPAIGLACRDGNRIKSRLLLLNDPGGGLKTLSQFRTASRALAKAFDVSELELFGAAVTNPKVRQMLLRNLFAVQTISLQAQLGGGELEIISRVFQVGA
ncbi:MAG TPA: hypothetical protein VIK18_06405 [Pirellulales bacterium]